MTWSQMKSESDGYSGELNYTGSSPTFVCNAASGTIDICERIGIDLLSVAIGC